MSSSGKKINYNVRTSKSVERRMLLFSLKELFKEHNIKTYRYIGFGSPYFTDYRLFHKELHIDDMISFEADGALKNRVEYNKPFKCIEIQMGKSTALLAKLEWPADKKNFLWMDYDGELEVEMFTDLQVIFTSINAGSAYVMTCNKQLKYTVNSFNNKFETLVPIDISELDFTGERDYKLIRRMMSTVINDTLVQRNLRLPPEEHLVFRQLFLFTYKDGAPMMSFGGIIDFVNSDFTLEKYNLQNFDFIKQADKAYHIDPPNLTYKEVHLLNEFLPNEESPYVCEANINFIPESDRKKYRKLYKYLPTYMDVVH